MQEITSTNNAKIKNLIQLQKKSSLRKALREFVIEGRREMLAALKNHFQLKSIFFYPDLFPEQELFQLLNKFEVQPEVIKISKNVYKKIAYRQSTEGVMAIAKMKEHGIDRLQLSDNPYVLVAEGIEKPGNVGAMLRSVDGASAEALILVNPRLDLYNPNVIRASLGMVFSIPVAICTINDLEAFLKNKKIRLFAAGLQNANVYFNEDYTTPTAIAVGAEDKGLTPAIRKIARQQIYIPMKGQADSLNVSVSAAVLLYEIVRQRTRQ